MFDVSTEHLKGPFISTEIGCAVIPRKKIRLHISEKSFLAFTVRLVIAIKDFVFLVIDDLFGVELGWGRAGM